MIDRTQYTTSTSATSVLGGGGGGEHNVRGKKNCQDSINWNSIS